MGDHGAVDVVLLNDTGEGVQAGQIEPRVLLPQEAVIEDPDLLTSLTPPHIYADNRINFRLLRDFLADEAARISPDVRRLEEVGLVGRTKEEYVEVPWDTVEAQLRLAA